MISFEKIYLKSSYKCLEYNILSDFVQSICPLVSQTSEGFYKLCRRRLIGYNSSAWRTRWSIKMSQFCFVYILFMAGFCQAGDNADTGKEM